MQLTLPNAAASTILCAQEIIDGKMDKRKRGVYGPPQGKQMVIFVDDLNMPQVLHSAARVAF